MQYEVGRGRSLPVTIWAVWAQIYHMSVTVWEPAGDGTYKIAIILGTPMVFAPAGTTVAGGRHLDVLWCCAADPSARLQEHASEGRPAFAGPEGNHFMLLWPEGAPPPATYRGDGIRPLPHADG